MEAMPLFYLRRLTGSERTETANRHLARILAFVAGAVNAGGFLAVRQYASHMSGIVSGMADDLALGNLSPVFGGVAAVLAFLLGATLTSLLILWARARSLESVYALPLIVEAALLIFFGLTGHIFAGARLLGTVMLLCFTMGLQNAMITKLSNSVIRTTHLTGMVTDTGIALGRLVFAVFGRREQHGLPELALNLARDFASLRLLTSLIGLFFMGGVSGALGFRHIGFFFTLPFAAVLLLMAAMPVLADIEQRRSPARAD